MLMTIVYSLKDNLTDIASLLFIVVGFLNDPIKELSATHFFCHEVIVFGFVKDIIQPDNVWMFEILENRDFILESDLIFVCKLGLGNNLDGKRFTRLFVRSLLDLGKGSFTELYICECVVKGVTKNE